MRGTTKHFKIIAGGACPCCPHPPFLRGAYGLYTVLTGEVGNFSVFIGQRNFTEVRSEKLPTLSLVEDEELCYARLAHCSHSS